MLSFGLTNVSRTVFGPHGRRFVAFGAVGILVMLVGAFVLYAGVEWFGLPVSIAYGIQVLVAVNLSFFLNLKFTWADSRATEIVTRTVVRQWLTFVGGRMVSIFLTTTLFAAISSNAPYLVAHFASIAVVAVANYLFNDAFVFSGAHVSRRVNTPVWPFDAGDGTPKRTADLSIVLPVKGNRQTVATTVASILGQEFSGVLELLVVVDQEDPAFAALQRANFDDPRLLYVHPQCSFPIPGNDANWRRGLGMREASAPVIALVDADMVFQPDWANTGVDLISANADVSCVCGTMKSVDSTRFWQAYVDLNLLGSKTPRWRQDVTIDRKGYGRNGSKPGVTANLFVTREALSSCGLPRPDFAYGYEDYAFLYDLVESGQRMLATPRLTGRQFHRDTLRDLVGEYVFSGQGCADFVWSYPRSYFARKRSVQVGSVLLGAVLSIWGIATSPTIVGFLLAAVLGALGIWHALKVSAPQAAIFPVITLLFGAAFTYGFVRGLARGGPISVREVMGSDVLISASSGEMSAVSNPKDAQVLVSDGE